MTSTESQKSSSLSPRSRWIISKAKGKIILDIGFVADKDFEPVVYEEIIKSNPQSFVIGLDINLTKLKKLKFKNTIGGDLFNLPIKTSSIDCVIAGEIFEHLYCLEGALMELSRVIKSGGQLIVTTPSPYGLFRLIKHWFLSSTVEEYSNIREYLGNYDHKMFWEPLSLSNITSAHGFKTKEIITTNLSIPYLPANYRNPNLLFWPFNRLGTYECFEFVKI